MNVTELMAQVRTEMTGNVKKDMEHIQDIMADLRNEPNSGELLAALAEYAFGMMPPEAREEMEKRTFVSGKRMDLAFGDALNLVRTHKITEAAAILSVISEKIAQYFEGDDPKYFCFRNPFEYHMYRMMYPEDTNFDRAPFDFSKYLRETGTLGFCGTTAIKPLILLENSWFSMRFGYTSDGAL